jgi:hypothetical protein
LPSRIDESIGAEDVFPHVGTEDAAEDDIRGQRALTHRHDL